MSAHYCPECGHEHLPAGDAAAPAPHVHVWGPLKGPGRLTALAVAKGWEEAVCVECGATPAPHTCPSCGHDGLPPLVCERCGHRWYAAPAPLDALRARISFEAINGVRPVWVAEGVFEQYAARTAECSPVTVEWGEPDADGFYSPVFTEHPEPAPLDVERLADALTVLPQTAWDPCMAASVDEVAAAIAAAYTEETP